MAYTTREPLRGKGIHITIDWGNAKQVLDPAIYKTALAEGMLEAASVLMGETSKNAPIFEGMRPVNPIGTPLEQPGSLGRSLQIRRVGSMILIISTHQAVKFIIEGHDALKKLGQRKWFFANYPNGTYQDVKGNPVPPDDWTMSEEEGITFITQIVRDRIQAAVPSGGGL
jgi:hypothetical protein